MSRFKADETLMFDPVPACAGALEVVYAYPNEYAVGICSLGYQLVWSWLATREDVQVYRWFTDARDELPHHLRLLGFSFSWEMDYVNVQDMLHEAQVPLMAVDRGEADPFVFVGGPVTTANPEPFAAFFDIVLRGDGEALVAAFLDAVAATQGGTRRERLIAFSQLPGCYVPSLYQPTYADEGLGALTAMTPTAEGVPPSVSLETYRGNVLAASTVVSPRMAWENIYMVEVVRSCPEMCRFCLASYLTLPFRTADVEGSLIPLIEKGMAVTDRIGLLGASVTQHPDFEQLLDHMMEPDKQHVRLSIASVRTNTVTEGLAAKLAARGTKSLTVAVESGSERVRLIVNKKLTSGEIEAAAAAAQAGGLTGLKLYGMVGVPGEVDADVDATIDMLAAVKAAAPRLKITFGCSTFVPKAHTPFQWRGLSKRGGKRLQVLEKACRKLNVDFRPESYKWSVVQALLSRGDRRLTRLLLHVREYGNTLGSFRRAFNELEGQLPDLEWYAHREADNGAELMPWSHLAGPLPSSTLVKHASEAAALAEAPRLDAPLASVDAPLASVDAV